MSRWICGECTKGQVVTPLMTVRCHVCHGEWEREFDFDSYDAWAAEGETFHTAKRMGMAFRLGAWWADRPWRTKK